MNRQPRRKIIQASNECSPNDGMNHELTASKYLPISVAFD
jgi:hypothetical protein